MYTILEGLSQGVLRVAVVQHLVQQLVDESEVLTDGLLSQLATVVFEDLDDAIQELNGAGGGDVESEERKQEDGGKKGRKEEVSATEYGRTTALHDINHSVVM